MSLAAVAPPELLPRKVELPSPPRKMQLVPRRVELPRAKGTPHTPPIDASGPLGGTVAPPAAAADPAARVAAKAGRTEVSLSVGSQRHAELSCKPCAFFHKADGCANGIMCQFCHLCEEGEKGRRRKERTIERRTARKTRRQQVEEPCREPEEPTEKGELRQAPEDRASRAPWKRPEEPGWKGEPVGVFAPGLQGPPLPSLADYLMGLQCEPALVAEQVHLMHTPCRLVY